MKNKFYLFFLIAFFSYCHSLAQVVLSYYPVQSVIGISSPTSKKVFVDLKLETNTFFTNTNLEFSPKIILQRKAKHFFYSGPGVSINPTAGFSDLPITNGYFLDFGIRLNPLEVNKNFQVIFEVSPFISNEFLNGSLRSKFGLGWEF